MQFNLCESTGFFVRVALIGPAGSGKTYSALNIATRLGYKKIGIIDTENRSARRYAKAFPERFQSLELSHFSPRDYIEAIRAAEQAGIEVLVIDSLSHAWAGKGGVLEMVDQSARKQSRGGNPSSFNGWREVTPEHNRLVEALVQCRMHLFITMRTKTEYVIDKDDKGRAVPRKVGLQPVQRDGLEYECDVVADVSPEHALCLSKTRCPLLPDDRVYERAGAEVAQALRAWIDDSGPVAPEDRDADPRPGRLAPPRRADDHDPDRAEQGQEAAGEPGASDPAHRNELEAIVPWLNRIQEAEEKGSDEHLDRVREEMNAALRKRTRAQGEALRRAIEAAKAAIKGRQSEAASDADPDAHDIDDRAA